jgi:hypothetical protein
MIYSRRFDSLRVVFPTACGDVKNIFLVIADFRSLIIRVSTRPSARERVCVNSLP